MSCPILVTWMLLEHSMGDTSGNHFRIVWFIIIFPFTMVNCHLGDLQFLEISNPMIKRLRFGGSAISSENLPGSSIGGNDRVWCFLCWPFGPIDFGCFGHGQKLKTNREPRKSFWFQSPSLSLAFLMPNFHPRSWIISHRIRTAEWKQKGRQWCVPLRLGSSIFHHFLDLAWATLLETKPNLLFQMWFQILKFW